MSESRFLATLATAIAGIFFLAGCSHAVLPQSGNSGSNSNGTVIMTIHDTPPTGTTVTSFEVSITGAVLEPGNVSLITNGQTVELTQLQTNSVYLNTATSVAPATYTSLQVTYANPEYTILNNTGAAITEPSGQCAANTACVVSSPTAKLTNTINFSQPLTISQTTPTLLELDVNLNNVIQPDYSVDFTQSGSVAVTTASGSSLSTIGTVKVAGQVQSVDASSDEFQLLASTGQAFNIATTANTIFEFGREGCMPNNFTCITPNQVLDVTIDIQSDGQTFDAGEIDYDDAANTTQVSGTVIAENGNPPSSVQMVVHNTIPAQSSLPPGTPVTVDISNSASYVINNGSFVLSGLTVTFGSASDVIVGQEMEARVASNSSITNGSFTSDRLALEQTQLQATVLDIESNAQPYPFFDLGQLSTLFSSEASGLQILDTTSIQTTPVQYQNLSPASIMSLQPQQAVTVGGFLFNTAPNPEMIVTVVRPTQNP